MPIGISTGAAILGAGAIGAGASIYSSNRAANAQTSAANQANQLQTRMFDQTQQNLAPFIQQGSHAWDILAPLLGMDQNGNNRQTDIYGNPVQQGFGALTNPFQPTQEFLESTPGYQFQRQQGLNAVQNSASARGLSSSGNALRGAADYASGLASSNWQQQFQDYQSQNKSIYDMLYGPTQQGATAASNQGQISANVGGQIGQNTIGAGNAQGAAAMAQGNAIGSAANNAAGFYYQDQLFGKYFGGPQGGMFSGNGSLSSMGGGYGGGTFGGPGTIGVANPLLTDWSKTGGGYGMGGLY